MKKLNFILVAVLSLMMMVLAGCMGNNSVPEKAPKEQVKVVLYLPNETASGVKKEIVEMNKDDVTPTKVLERLIAEETKDEYSVIPKDLKVKEIRVSDGLAYVEFNEAFLKPQGGGSLTERLELASIVNTLTEFNEINEVMFLVNGDPVTQISGHVDMTNPLKRIQDLIVAN